MTCLIPQEVATFRRYVELAEPTNKLAQSIISNQLRYATNCGQDYLPVGIEDILTQRNEEQRLRQHEEIKRTLEPFMYLTPMGLNLNVNFQAEAARRISADFAERHVSVHWYPTDTPTGERKQPNVVQKIWKWMLSWKLRD